MKFSPIRVEAHRYRIGTNIVADPVVRYGCRSLLCDGKLPMSLSRLVPHRWGNAQPSEWQPFVERAVVLGLL